VRGASPGLALALLLAASAARGQEQEPVRWDPGQRTTSRVEGQIEAPDPEPISDGVYGRFDGDLELALGAGLELDEAGSRGALRLALHYFSMLGLSSGFAERVRGAGSERVVSIGVDLRPAFIPRWTKDMQQGPGVLDLLIDSISLGVGAFWAQPGGGTLGDARGFELSGGLGAPLFGRASGPWLEARALGRWPEQHASSSGRGEAVALFVLSWHAFASTPLAD
jgi:hypothetical protein